VLRKACRQNANLSPVPSSGTSKRNPLASTNLVCISSIQLRSCQSNCRWVNWRFASSRGVAEFARKGQPRWLSHGTHVSSV
jgi:hypothetical protein